MKIISHRGNLYGKDLNVENKPSQIDRVIEKGYDVEIDLRYEDRELYLGHDHSEYKISYDWLNERKNKLWIHAKDHDCISFLKKTNFNWFWHEKDDMTLTSHGYIWSNVGIFIESGITVTLELSEIPDYILGICTDEPIRFQNNG
jgi:hypothetical protein